MSSFLLAPIQEKGGHRIIPRVTQEFRPTCAQCNFEFFWYSTPELAREVLREHLIREHNSDLRPS